MPETNETIAEKKDIASYILFDVAGTTYGINIRFVNQLEMVGNITPVPNTPGYLEGVMFSRGKVIPVINLRTRLGFEKTPYDFRTRVIVTNYKERNVGLIADTAKEYVSLPADSIEPAPEFIRNKGGAFVEGVTRINDRTVLIFNIEEIIVKEQENLDMNLK
jgi:purine-binding chemotaxis protein CheW